MFDVLLVVGKSGSGKDTFVSELLKTNDIYNKVITCTTRPKRENEQDGCDYYFKTEEEFKNMEMIEQTVFNGWYYGTPIFSFDSNKINVVIVNPQGVRYYVYNDIFNIITIYYLQADDKIRLARQKNRDTKSNLQEMQRRYEADEKDFLNFEKYIDFHNIPLIIRDNNTLIQLQANIEDLNLFIEHMDKNQ